MTKQLAIGTTSKGKAFTLPLDLITQTVAILAKRGVGKTTTGAVISEELMDAGQRICVIDPTGAHWGLKSTADGKGAAYPVVIFGGEHADAPLEKGAGEILARAVAEGDFSCIIDLSAFRKGETIQFLTSFFEEIYRLNRRPLHLVCDEADTYAPQKPMPNQLQCLGAIEDVIKKGRIRGLGATLITLRSAIINKNVLAMCEILVAMRAVHPADIAPVKEWVSVHGDPDTAKTLVASLPSLPVGAAWFYSPGWGDIFERVQVRPRRTFDSSATPKPGAKVTRPKVLAKVDMERLSAEIRATIEKAKAEDPKELRKQLAAAQAELAKERAKPIPKAPPAPAPEVRIVKVPVITDAQLKRLESLVGRIETEAKRQDENRLTYTGDMKAISSGIRESIRSIAATQTAPAAMPPPPAPKPRAPDPAPVSDDAGEAPTVDGVNKPEQRLLDAIAWLNAIGVAEPEHAAVAAFANYAMEASSFKAPRASLRNKGLIEYRRDRLVLTPAGRAVARDVDVPRTNAGLQARIMENLSLPERRLLQPLLDAYPRSMTNQDLAQTANYEVSASSYKAPRARLKALCLIEYVEDGVRARDILFPER